MYIYSKATIYYINTYYCIKANKNVKTISVQIQRSFLRVALTDSSMLRLRIIYQGLRKKNISVKFGFKLFMSLIFNLRIPIRINT
jgi:hypothetical protein